MASADREEAQRAAREAQSSRGPSAQRRPRAAEETSLLGFANVVLRHRRLIGGCALLATLVFVASALMESRSYSTRVLFTARGAKSGLLAGIAAQYGLSIVGSDPSQSIELYEDLLTSRELLREVGRQQYQIHVGKQVKRGRLSELYGIHAGNRGVEADLAVDELRSHVYTNASHRTGMVTYFVSAPNPELAQQIAANMLTQLDLYNSRTRRSQATAERSFIEKQLDESRLALAAAEDQLRQFRDVNREYTSSAKLSLENERFDRQIAMRQQLYTALSQAYEQARIEEVRDIPAISIVEPPELPNAPDTAYGMRNILLGAIAGVLIGIVLAFVRERFHETRASGSQTFSEFADLKRAALGDLARPWQPVGRLFRAHSGP
jgi:uncharacterized protein involved in exopolysaccharide biosynthesis